MGATEQPAERTERRDTGSRPWWEDRGPIASAVLGAGVVICTAVIEVVDQPTQVVLVVVTIVLVLASLAGLVRMRTYARLFASVRRWTRGHRTVALLGAVALVAGSTGAAVALRSAQSCEDPTEVAVMVPEDGAPGFSAAADAFERASTTAFSCPRYHLTTFGVGWPALRAAFASGWGHAPGEAGAASLELGPRPDVWLAESGAQVDIVAAEGAGQRFTLSGRTLVAGSPLVLAVPEPHAEALRATTGPGDSIDQLMAAAAAADIDVVRANPDVSFAAALHTVDLYVESDAEALELDLGHALEEVGLPIGTDGALLCRLDELSRTEPPRVAVLTTERATAGRGTACPAPDADGGRSDLVPFHAGSAPGLDYTAVRLTWADAEPAGRRAEAASAFAEWLRTAEGQAALKQEVGARGLDGRPPSDADGPLPGLEDAPVIEPGANLVAHTRIVSAEERYRTARRPAQVLVLVDASASMGRPADGDRQRIDVAERGVLGALGHLSGSDKVGIWSFSGTAGSSPRRVLDLTSSEVARHEAPEHLGALRPGGRTPLYDAVDAGTSYLVGLDPGGASRRHLTALVVLTDGENLPGGGAGAELTAADLVASARAQEASGVRVYVVAVGEASCQGSDLQKIAAEWDGECWDSSFGELESTLGSMFGQLGGR
ncbi:vWA domain-containing protein [Promicromonospora iranensis]|uniref:Mg-chelatase subunit ChlD n=1 Tax=Promicromonospora iranensis TaxID=1105144 RepID=A0ABU2CHQ7_9MICO|nr:substrate-binding domain-containing protein [Promicromonospora iranensis]MDR7380865.1 Mg-chelatase subunit ChlD [Promicromonospora iranensis]